MHDYFTLRQQHSADDWLLADFARQYPGISFDRDLSPRHTDLVGEHVNVAIRLGTVKGDHLSLTASVGKSWPCSRLRPTWICAACHNSLPIWWSTKTSSWRGPQRQARWPLDSGAAGVDRTPAADPRRDELAAAAPAARLVDFLANRLALV